MEICRPYDASFKHNKTYVNLLLYLGLVTRAQWLTWKALIVST